MSRGVVSRGGGAEQVTGEVTSRPHRQLSDLTSHGRSVRVVSARGQASVELVVLLPVILVVLAAGYQAVLAGQAIWDARVAARAAARANSLGADASAAARAHLPPGLERGLRVEAGDDGDVEVSVRVPTVIPSIRLGRVSATSHFRPQSG
ncbi:hypothetical protein [Solirubrobacter soli]|uniref:hypothetical protein n=1 Tax=Solirubrobacter soli TaxID=363832 RepID=UPI0012FC1D9A|nr:hypothetical protein [Solirubrobacter soli]